MPVLFDTIINVGSVGTPFTTNNTEIGGVFGPRTLIYLIVSGNLTFIGLNPTGGPVDKSTVAILNVSNNSFTTSFAHDSSSTGNVNRRFLNPALSALNTGTGIGGVEYVYNAGMSRWICLSRTQ